MRSARVQSDGSDNVRPFRAARFPTPLETLQAQLMGKMFERIVVIRIEGRNLYAAICKPTRIGVRHLVLENMAPFPHRSDIPFCASKLADQILPEIPNYIYAVIVFATPDQSHRLECGPHRSRVPTMMAEKRKISFNVFREMAEGGCHTPEFAPAKNIHGHGGIVRVQRIHDAGRDDSITQVAHQQNQATSSCFWKRQ